MSKATDKRTLIIGLGKTGLSVARYLSARGNEVAVADDRATPPGLDQLRAELPDVGLFLGEYPEAALQRAERLVVSPGVSVRHPAIAAAAARGVEVIGDIELFARAARAPVVAITGSNGKSTVTTLVGMMAAAAGMDVRVGGNLGTPALDLLDDSEPQLYVLELSSFQLETTHALNAAAATVLNLSVDHMDRYDGMSDYAAAKQRIFQGDGVMVLNNDDALVAAMSAPGRRCVSFTLHTPTGDDYGIRAIDGKAWLARGEQCLLACDELRITGAHNWANALAALALGDAVGLPMPAMLEVLRRFEGLPHRTQWVGERDGVRWYNDSKGTNVGATLAAVAGMPGQVVLIAGGLGKDADFAPLQPVLADKARAVVLIGRDAPLIEAALAGCVPVRRATSMEDAVTQARAAAQPGDAVLLSPACASFDMFKNYEDRGEQFSAAVRRVLA